MSADRLLFVDDDPAICSLVAEIAQNCDYQVITVSAGKAFKEAYTDFSPSLVMLDLHLGSEDGVQLLRFLAHANCTSPVVILSGYDDKILTTAMLLGESYGLKIVATLRKPFKLNQLSELLNTYKSAAVSMNLDDLSKAIKDNQFILHYQPQINLIDQKIMGVEALVRWQSSPNNLVYPDDFIPEIENSELIKPLTENIIRMALKQLSDWITSGIDLKISINISPKYLDNLEIPEYFEELAKEFNIKHDRIYWEITETAIMDEPKLIMDILTRLRLKNFNLSMDDFGTGYASMFALHQMPFNQIKIDKSFIFKVDKDPSLEILTRHMLSLFRELKIESVAEGIENELTLLPLQKHRCDIGQGYYFSKPIPPEDIVKWFKNRKR